MPNPSLPTPKQRYWSQTSIYSFVQLGPNSPELPTSMSCLSCYLGAHAKFQNPTTIPSGRISNEPGEKERKRRRNNAIYSGHLCLCQQPRAAHALRLDQNYEAIKQTKIVNTLFYPIPLFITLIVFFLNLEV
jgi:hypothetical protein